MNKRLNYIKTIILVILVFIVLKNCLGWPMEKVLQVIKYFGVILIPELFILLSIISLAYFIGNKIQNTFHVEYDSILEEFLISIGLGFGIIAFVNFILGHFHLLYSWIYWLVLIILMPKIFYCMYLFISQLKRKGINYFNTGRSNLEISLVIILLIHLFVALTISLVPDYSEGATVHLTIGSYYKMKHAIVHIPFMFYAEQPHLTEMIQLTCIMLLKSTVLCKLLNFIIYLLVLGTIYAISRRILPKIYALLGCAIFAISVGGICSIFYTFKEEVFLTLFTLLSFLILLVYFRKRKYIYLFLFVIMLGYVSGCKILFGFIPVLAMIPLFLFIELLENKRYRQKTILTCILILISVTILAIPWYIRQLVYHGNLFYPLSPFKTLTTGDRSAVGFFEDEHVVYNNDTNQFVFRHTTPFQGTIGDKLVGFAKGYCLFLWRMVREPKSFNGDSSSILFLILLPGLLFLNRPIAKEFKYFLLLGLFLYTLNYLCPATISRFYPLMVVLSVISAYVYYNLSRTSRVVNNFLFMIVGVVLVTFTITRNINHKVMSGFKHYWPVVFGVETREEFLQREAYGSYSTAKFVSKKLPKDAKLFFYALDTGFYYDENDYIWGDKIHAGEFIGYSKMNCAEDLLRRLDSLGITHIVLSSGYWPPRKGYNEENIHSWVKEIVGNYCAKLFEDKYISLYEIYYTESKK